MLPDVGYLVLMDKIYVLAYTLIIAGLIRVIYSRIKLSGMPDGSEVGIWRADKMMFVAFVLTFFISSAILVLYR